MTISKFPSALDVFARPQKITPLSGGSDSNLGHDAQHTTILDTLESIQKAVGVTNSTDADSLSYKMANHTHVVDWSNIQNKPSFNYSATSGNADYATNAGQAVSATSATNLTSTHWQVIETGGVLQFKYNGVTKMTLDSSGNLIAAGDITGFGL